MSELLASENQNIIKRSLYLSFSLFELCSYGDIQIKAPKFILSPLGTACGWIGNISTGPGF